MKKYSIALIFIATILFFAEVWQFFSDHNWAMLLLGFAWWVSLSTVLGIAIKKGDNELLIKTHPAMWKTVIGTCGFVAVILFVALWFSN